MFGQASCSTLLRQPTSIQLLYIFIVEFFLASRRTASPFTRQQSSVSEVREKVADCNWRADHLSFAPQVASLSTNDRDSCETATRPLGLQSDTILETAKCCASVNGRDRNSQRGGLRAAKYALKNCTSNMRRQELTEWRTDVEDARLRLIAGLIARPAIEESVVGGSVGTEVQLTGEPRVPEVVGEERALEGKWHGQVLESGRLAG